MLRPVPLYIYGDLALGQGCHGRFLLVYRRHRADALGYSLAEIFINLGEVFDHLLLQDRCTLA